MLAIIQYSYDNCHNTPQYYLNFTISVSPTILALSGLVHVEDNFTDIDIKISSFLHYINY